MCGANFLNSFIQLERTEAGTTMRCGRRMEGFLLLSVVVLGMKVSSLSELSESNVSSMLMGFVSSSSIDITLFSAVSPPF